MQLHTFLIDALDRVLARELPEEAWRRAVMNEAALMAGVDPEDANTSDLA